MEKDRNPSQNGKGSDSRVSNAKLYSDNYSQINWNNVSCEKVNSFSSSRCLKVGDTIFNLKTGKIGVVDSITHDDIGEIVLRFNDSNFIRYSRSELDSNWAYYNE